MRELLLDLIRHTLHLILLLVTMACDVIILVVLLTGGVGAMEARYTEVTLLLLLNVAVIRYMHCDKNAGPRQTLF